MFIRSKVIYLLFAVLFCFFSSCELIPSGPQTTVRSRTAQNPQTNTTPVPANIQTLREAAQYSPHHSISIGTAANMDALNTDATYKTLLGQQFNLVVPENVMKMYVTHPDIDTFDYSQGDQLVAFAKAHNMQIEGANLIWGEDVPSWITQGNYTRQELLGIMKDYISNVVGHYKGQIQYWNVVNEPLDTDDSNQPTIWERVIGPDYIKYAFQWAHEADPQAKLYINEFDVEKPGAKADQYYNLVQELVKQGVPINGAGFEGHLDITQSYPQDQFIANMQRFAKLGLQVQITEADIKLQNSTAPMVEKLSQQAQLYAELIHVCQGVNTCNAVITWGFTDRYTWIPEFTHHPDQPLLYDEQYHPKPAYYAIKNALLSKK